MCAKYEFECRKKLKRCGYNQTFAKYRLKFFKNLNRPLKIESYTSEYFVSDCHI